MKKKIIWLCVTLFLMAAIFFFSSQNGSESSRLSDIFVQLLSFFHLSTYVVRKMAHMTIFGLLAISSYHLIENMPYTILFCFVYACTDEFHQLFIDGRAGQFMDVGYDTLGAFLFLCLFLCMRKKLHPTH